MAGISTITLEEGLEVHTATVSPGNHVMIDNEDRIIRFDTRRVQGVTAQAQREKDALLEAWQQLVTIVTKCNAPRASSRVGCRLAIILADKRGLISKWQA